MGSDKGAIFSREHNIQISDRRLLLVLGGGHEDHFES